MVDPSLLLRARAHAEKNMVPLTETPATLARAGPIENAAVSQRVVAGIIPESRAN